MSYTIFNLKKHCFTDNELKDDFVGIRNQKNELQICFPIGFNIGNEKEIKQDIRKLISILLEFNSTYPLTNAIETNNTTIISTFPLLAYKNIIEYFSLHGYYTETTVKYKKNTSGKINFLKTIKKNKPIIQKIRDQNSFVYINFQAKTKAFNEKALITTINRYCVYEAFSRIGFMFSSFIPPKFKLPINKKFCIHLLEKKIQDTFDDKKKVLFESMRNMLAQNDNTLRNSDFKFGTERFYVVWERMIDKAFGTKNKEKFFARTKWKLTHSQTREKYPLQPDSIMFYKDKIYILDAKYYKYGITAKLDDLPDTSSIAKQIIYGEYVAKKEKKKQIYNAFLMPYNKHNNPFGLRKNYENIGYAFGEWRDNTTSFEKIQGILVDTRYLMQNYANKPKQDLSVEIEQNQTTF